MRTDPKKLREEFKSKLTKEEIVALGANLAAGDDHYRAYVGPPFNYDIIGNLQFQFMLDLGLREYHKFLEIGCGSLRLGRLLITYLLPNRYYGIEPNRKILEEGMKYNLGSSNPEIGLLGLKKPSFDYNSDFDFGFVDDKVDFIVAQSIASHTGVAETEKLLSNINSVMHDDSIAMVTYIRCIDEKKNNTKDGWFYPECITYTDHHMNNLAKRLGLTARRTSWPLLNRRADGLITSQTPMILTRKPWEPTLAQKTASLFDQ